MSNRGFYVGYIPKMPKGIAKVIRPFVLLIFVLVLGLSAIFLVGQKPFAKSFFEFGNVQDFEGTIQAQPIPFLLVEKQQENGGLPAFKRIPLVGEGKDGAVDELKTFDGQRVTLKATRFHRDGLEMLEIASDSIKKSDASAQKYTATMESLGAQTLKGEIVDSKCYLGVMNPGQSKPHRECAVSCLRGGIPALFIVKDTKGNVSELWLLSEDGKPINDKILDYVAEPVQLRGNVRRLGDYLYFYTNPESIRRLR